MRIGLACDDSLDVLDGVQQYMLTCGEELRRRGHDVYYLVGETRRDDIEGLVSLGRITQLRFRGNLLRTSRPVSRAEARRAIGSLGLDVLHVQAPFGPFLAGRLLGACSPRVRVVATWHTVRGSAIVGAFTWVLRALVARPLRRIDASLAVSPATQEFVAASYGVTAEVLGCPVDVKALASAGSAPKPPGVRRIVFLGRLVPHKGPGFLLDALEFAGRRGQLPSGTELVIIGDGSLRGELEERAAGMALPIRFEGAQYGGDKAAWLASADVAVFPSVAESFGIVLLEAMAAGAGVVLAADNAGYRYVMGGDEEALFPLASTAALAARITSALGDQEYASRVHERQQERVTQFGVANVVDELERVYRGR